MGLLDELKKEEPPAKHICGVTKTLETMEKTDSADLLSALNDHGIMATSISRVLQRRGINLKPDAIRRHRKKDCRCE